MILFSSSSYDTVLKIWLDRVSHCLVVYFKDNYWEEFGKDSVNNQWDEREVYLKVFEDIEISIKCDLHLFKLYVKIILVISIWFANTRNFNVSGSLANTILV